MNPKAYWVGFNYVKGIGSVRLNRLLQAFGGDLKAAWEAPYEKLIAVRLHPRLVENVLRVRSQIDLERIWENIERKGIQVITWEEEAYPSLLRQIDQPPPVLYIKGEYLPEDELAVAVVGTRRVSAYGKQVAEELAAFLARNQVTVVSGLARGTDAVAHQSALREGGRTLAVLGCGVDLIYPPEHVKLAEEITANGALISDYPPGTPPESNNFPPRNRIISGLSLATIVIEAGETSGALITASFAADQGREVLAVPGNIHSPNSKGVNRLIQSGARPLLNPADVLEALNIQQINTRRIARKVLPSDETEAKLLQVMGNDNLTADEISFLSGLPIDKVSACLIMMELKGLVKNNGGTNYRAIREEAEYYGKKDE
ncbi:MAG TPA: DNA-protecting protein DprA [Anaerolineaceae bacterium]|nr:DNA-protecting protein DprA [Anaerolineaceae bacterium]